MASMEGASPAKATPTKRNVESKERKEEPSSVATAEAFSKPGGSKAAGPAPAAPLTIKDLDKGQRSQLYSELGLMEKGFTIGVLNLFANLVVLGRWPQHFWILHFFLGLVFLPWRFIRFRQRNMEWYMADFCYFVTYFTFAGCVVALFRCLTGVSTPLYQFNFEALRAGFAFANGAMVLSVPLFGNKLVFHDVDNTTSVYIHLSPALFFWSLRWGGGYGTSLIESAWPGMFDICRDMVEGDAAVSSVWGALWYSGPCAGSALDSVYEFMFLPAVCWFLFWGLPFFIVVLGCVKGYLDRSNKEYLYKCTIEDKKGNGRFITKLPPRMWPLGYMLQHFLWVVTAGLGSILLWRSFVLHTLLLSGIFLVAVHNGSSYMFRVVAARHLPALVGEVAAKPKTEPGSPTAGGRV